MTIYSREDNGRCKKGFPKLMRNFNTGAIFLMTSEGTGTKLNKGDGGSDPVGRHGCTWGGLEAFNGVLKLSNNSF